MTRFLFAFAIAIGFASTSDAQLFRRRAAPAPAVPLAAAPAPAAPAAAAPAGAITDDHRKLYDHARTRAIGQLARKKNISRAEAKQMIDDEATDEVLHWLVAASGLKIKSKASGKFTDFIDWLIANQDAIMKLIQMIMALFGGIDADTATITAIEIAWDVWLS